MKTYKISQKYKTLTNLFTNITCNQPNTSDNPHFTTNNKTPQTSDNNLPQLSHKSHNYPSKQSSKTPQTLDNNFSNSRNKSKTLIKTISYSQIFLLLLAVFAFALVVGEVRLVSGDSFQDSKLLIPGNADRTAYLKSSLTEKTKDKLAEEDGKKNTEDAAEGTAGTISGFLTALYGGTLIEGAPGALLGGLAWGGTVAAIIKIGGSFLGIEPGKVNAAALASFGGISTWKSISLLANKGVIEKTSFLAKNAPLIGLGVGIAIFVLTYKKESQKIIQFQCQPWEPPLGGNSCDECNNDPLRPCSEYRCRSLGQACQILNPGTMEEKCAWVNPGDVTSPVLTPDATKLKPNDLSYKPDNSIRPPNRGTKIVRAQDSCLQAFTQLEFGITTNEPAQCKLDYLHTSNMDEMQFFFGENNLFLKNHTQKMRLPAPDTEITDSNATAPGSPLLLNDGTYSLFVRCQDANGNENVDEYVFNFCVDKSPDTTPPIIEEFSITSGSPVSFNAEEIEITAYINEPAECKWSRQSKDYNEMENSMQCSDQISVINANQLYPCKSTLTGIKNKEENKFYFRCRDQPDSPESDRYTNTQSKELILLGTQPLDIIEVGPNETIRGSTDTVPVSLVTETSNGAQEGISICYFSPSGNPDSFVKFFDTNSFEHKQTLDLTSGNYEYHFRCIDLGGNSAEASTEFTVFSDKQPPLVVRAYKQEGLKIVTNEDAECAYSLSTCNFNFQEGLALLYSNPEIKTNHFAEWNPNSIYHIKCRDLQNNQPAPSSCSIIVSAIELSQNI